MFYTALSRGSHSEPHGVSSVVGVGHGSKKHNFHQSEERSNPLVEASELLSSNGISPAILERIIPEQPRSSSNAGEHPVEISEEMDLAIANKGNHLLIMSKDIAGSHDDLKLLLSQISAARGFELSWNDVIPSLRELEEERNAAAISTNQAMAMINRLQKEKATMQMEALQYQRMMEEQAEYDQEALQKLNDLLTEKEKEVQDLEAELEDYRKGTWNELEGGKTDSSRREVGAVSHNSHRGGNHHDKCSKIPCDHGKTDRIYGDGKGNKLDIMKDTLFDFENEQLYLMKCLNGI
ncbi:hypothetical protein ACLOJK_014945 [Asimina triloba]